MIINFRKYILGQKRIKKDLLSKLYTKFSKASKPTYHNDLIAELLKSFIKSILKDIILLKQDLNRTIDDEDVIKTENIKSEILKNYGTIFAIEKSYYLLFTNLLQIMTHPRILFYIIKKMEDRKKVFDILLDNETFIITYIN